jgi:UDP-N-acetylmuramoyl-tripeptide--D-alanyl-D-alanine ligase
MNAMKKRFYFMAARYFAFWARIVLDRWKPRIIIITGSSGKTTLLHLSEAQLGEQAVFSHHANSAIGISFHILGMPANVSSKPKWILYFCSAPFYIFRSVPNQKIYIVEADTDRPGEGAFISNFLKPEVTLWVSVSRTHVMNFDAQVRSGEFKTPEEAIAYDFGNYSAAATKLVLANGDQPDLVAELSRVSKEVLIEEFSLKDLKDYRLGRDATIFKFKDYDVKLPGLHPRQVAISVQMISALLKYLEIPERPYNLLTQPPGRSSVFRGKKNITIIDSTYNSGLGAIEAMLDLFEEYKASSKWVVISDILEQGSLEKDEHENLAHLLKGYKFDQIVLLGDRSKSFVLPILNDEAPHIKVVAFTSPKEVLDYLNKNLKGDEAVLFKGAKGLEGVVEQLLQNPSDASQLVRREQMWVKRRQAWGLPR